MTKGEHFYNINLKILSPAFGIPAIILNYYKTFLIFARQTLRHKNSK